jgi:very-short-patch-repair endonuclease
MTTPAALSMMRHQAGAISRAQAAEAGLTDRQVQRLVQIGRWTRLVPGVYASAETAPSWHTWGHAALLAAGHGAVLVGESAVALRRLVPKTLPVTAAIPTGRQCRWRPTGRSSAIRIIRLDVRDDECVTVDGLRTTTRLRTAIDVAHLMPLHEAQPVLDRMLVLDQVSLEELTQAVVASRRTGSKQARRLLASANDRTAAESERMARRLFRSAGITGWVSNHPVKVRSGTIKVDLALPRLKIAVEVKGWQIHSKSDRGMGDDRRVTNLGIAGWIVIPVGWLELVTDPEGVLARVRAAIAARLAEAA